MADPSRPADESEHAATLDRAGLVPGGYAVLHPGASSPTRRLPAERFAAVGDALADDGLTVVVTGVPGEHAISTAVTAAMRTPAGDPTGAPSPGGVARGGGGPAGRGPGPRGGAGAGPPAGAAAPSRWGRSRGRAGPPGPG